MVPGALFKLFGRGVHLYGISIAVGIIACLIVFYVYTSKMKVPSRVQDFVYFVAIGAIVVGFVAAMLYQAFYDYLENPSNGFVISGAVTVMGGLIGGAAAFLALYFGVGKFVFKKDRLHVRYFGEVFRTAPICITVAHGFGRIGCMFAGCCHGWYLGQEYVFGGVWMQGSGVWGYYVPTQIYEAAFLFALTAVLSVLYFKKYNHTMATYLIAYGIWRIFIEFFRADHRGGTGLLSPSQWQSFLFIAGGIALILVFKFLLKIPAFGKREEKSVSSDLKSA